MTKSIVLTACVLMLVIYNPPVSVAGLLVNGDISGQQYSVSDNGAGDYNNAIGVIQYFFASGGDIASGSAYATSSVTPGAYLRFSGPPYGPPPSDYVPPAQYYPGYNAAAQTSMYLVGATGGNTNEISAIDTFALPNGPYSAYAAFDGFVYFGPSGGSVTMTMDANAPAFGYSSGSITLSAGASQDGTVIPFAVPAYSAIVNNPGGGSSLDAECNITLLYQAAAQMWGFTSPTVRCSACRLYPNPPLLSSGEELFPSRSPTRGDDGRGRIEADSSRQMS